MAVDASNTPNPDSQSSLLPCPFCGGHPDRVSYEDEFWIACSSCGAAGEKCEPWEFINKTTEEAEWWASKVWNTRAEVAEIDDLRAALTAINIHLGSAETHDPVVENITRTALGKDWPRAKVAS